MTGTQTTAWKAGDTAMVRLIAFDKRIGRWFLETAATHDQATQQYVWPSALQPLPANAEIERLRAALERLAGCDWIITPLDRMDAVRDIARAALNGSNERPHS